MFSQAQSWGLVWRAVPAEALEAEAGRMAAKMAGLKPEVARRFKRVLNEVGLAHFMHAIDLENESQRALHGR